MPYEVLDPAGCIAAEPGLATAKVKFVGGLRLPQDETGDCHMFTQALAAEAARLGVQFKFNTSIERLVAEGGKITGVVTSAGMLQADAYVAALGSWSPRMLKPIGIAVPVYPVKGYSITVPIIDADGAPVSTVMDESYKVAITRLGDRIRVGGTAEISGYSSSLDAARRATLDHSLTDMFPRGGDLSKATFWCGLRPMTPDGPPVIGATRYSNLHLNTGHGTLGWTMACGSGRVLADLMSGRKPDIDVSELDGEPVRAAVWVRAHNARRRHCERSEAIHLTVAPRDGLLRRCAPRNDGESCRYFRSDDQGKFRYWSRLSKQMLPYIFKYAARRTGSA